ncbi:MAG: aspartate-semialdehyde dehydrogenase [Planctomycetota bacterium]
MKRVAVVGAGGAVGKEMLTLLQRAGLPQPPTLYGSERSRGTTVPFAGDELPVLVLEEANLREFDVALFAASGAVAKEWAPRFVAAGAKVIDNSSAFRLTDGVPLVVPEINGTSIEPGPGIIANPNCSTIVLLLGIHPLLALGEFRVVASTYQAVSGAGRAGFEALERERAGGAFEAGNPFPFPIGNNLFPLIGDVESDAAAATTEEAKMVRESQKILDRPGLEIFVTCVRVPVERCHSESVTLFFDEPVQLQAARDCLAAAPGLTYCPDPLQPPMPGPLAGQINVAAGRLRQPAPQVLQLWLVGDQLLKGAALNAVQIAERCW